MPLTKLGKTYHQRRQYLQQQTEQGTILITVGKSSPDPNLFDKNLEYLVGKVPLQSVLLLIPHGVQINHRATLSGPEVGRGIPAKEILFIPKPRSSPFPSGGPADLLKHYQDQTGCECVKWLSEMKGTLSRALLHETTLWVNISYTPTLNQPIPPDLKFLNEIRSRYLWLQINNIAPLIHRMRWVKDAHEQYCLKQAFQIHTEIYEKIMTTLKAGMNESVGKAIYDYEIALRDPHCVSGEWHDNYEANIIVAAGKNAVQFHYMKNNCSIKDGDLVLIDAGVEYEGYCSDITRTFPANGKFTPRQRELYEIVLEAEKAAIAAIKPGVTQREVHYAAYQIFKKYGLDQYSYGNAGHAVGLNIHDANDWGVSDRPLEIGSVIVVEPQLKLFEEGIGIRIEDGVIVTEDGCEELAGPPKEIEAIEQMLAKK